MQRIIKEKKKVFFLEKLDENIAELKELWKNLKRLDHPKAKAPSSHIYLKENESLSFCFLSIANNFK